MSKALNELITEMGQLFEGYAFTEEELNKLEVLYAKLKVVMAKEFEYPFEEREDCWVLDSFGDVHSVTWTNHSFDTSRYSQGHIFKTEQEAKRECDRRLLLTRFRRFRDKCNGDWKPFEHGNQFYISFDTMTNVIHTNCVYINKSFALFGYFKNKSDAERAIELFGDEIKRLYVEVE